MSIIIRWIILTASEIRVHISINMTDGAKCRESDLHNDGRDQAWTNVNL